MAYQLNLNNPFASFTSARQASDEELRRKQEARMAAEEAGNRELNDLRLKTAQMAEESAARKQQAIIGLGEKAIGIADQYYDNKIKKQETAEERAIKAQQIEDAQQFEMGKLIAQQEYEKPFKQAQLDRDQERIAVDREQLAQRGEESAAASAFREKQLAQELKIAQANNASRQQIASLQNELKQAQIESKMAASAVPKPLTEAEKLSSGFLKRMEESNTVVDSLEKKGYQTPGVIDQAFSGSTYLGGLASSEGQQFDQAKRNFISSVLRKESGAAISPQEYQSEEKKYFPMPGDKPEVIAQKSAARKQAIENMMLNARQDVPTGQSVADAPSAAAPLADWKSKLKQKPMPASR